MSVRTSLPALTHPERLYAREDLPPRGALPPSKPGLYAWYFEGPVGAAPMRGCHRVWDRALMYVGIAPSSPGSRATLRSRIRQHFRGNAAASTLRKTLACLLGLELRRIGASERIRLQRSDEQALSDWMDRNARVCWVAHPRPWEIEARVISSLNLPLNLDHNASHPFAPALRALRKNALEAARQRPVVRKSRPSARR